MDGWEISLFFGVAYFHVRTVSFREGNYLRIGRFRTSQINAYGLKEKKLLHHSTSNPPPF